VPSWFGAACWSHVAVSFEKPVVASALRVSVGESAAAANDFYVGRELRNSKKFREMALKTQGKRGLCTRAGRLRPAAVRAFMVNPEIIEAGAWK
jgi:hypothetical protein